jgi:hypothetical protein
MFFAVIALAATLTAPAAADTAAQAVLIRGTASMDRILDEAEAYLRGGIVEEPRGPRTGLIVFSPSEKGEDGLHAVWVVGVMAGGPAARAGIMAGDRILAIGARRLEHETTDIVVLLLDLKPGPVTLSLSRGGTQLQATVVREPMGCLLAIPDAIGRDSWLARFASLRALNGMLRERITAGPLTAEELAASKGELDGFYRKYQALSETLDFSVNAAIRSTCKVQTSQ